MMWEKLGLIFNPADYDLGLPAVGYAQGPQALVFDDFVRIYFSTRRRSPNGKFISCIRYVDFKKNLKEIIHVGNTEVIQEGKLGAFDEHGIFPMNVVRADNKIFAYTCGWSRRTSVSIDMSIGLATSVDEGQTFKRLGDGPVLTASLNEPFLVGDPFVVVEQGNFHMWYIFGTHWKKYAADSLPDRTYKIGHATSADGINWKKEDGKQVVPDQLGDDESQALPSVIKIGGLFHMVFCFRQSSDFRQNSARGYKLGYAFSDDLTNWTRQDEALGISPSEHGWDAEMMCYPHIFECDNEIYLLYNGNEFGKYGFGLAKLKR